MSYLENELTIVIDFFNDVLKQNNLTDIEIQEIKDKQVMCLEVKRLIHHYMEEREL